MRPEGPVETHGDFAVGMTSPKEEESCVKRRIMQLMKGATPAEWRWFTIPWPAIWAIARYHKKHIMIWKSPPKLKYVGQDLYEFFQSIKRKWVRRRKH